MFLVFGIIACVVLFIVALAIVWIQARRSQPPAKRVPPLYPTTVELMPVSPTDVGESHRIPKTRPGSRWYSGGYNDDGDYYGSGYYPYDFLDGILWNNMVLSGVDDIDCGGGGDFGGGGASGDDYSGSVDTTCDPAPEVSTSAEVDTSCEPSYDSSVSSDSGSSYDSPSSYDSGGGSFDSGGGGDSGGF